MDHLLIIVTMLRQPGISNKRFQRNYTFLDKWVIFIMAIGTTGVLIGIPITFTVRLTSWPFDLSRNSRSLVMRIARIVIVPGSPLAIRCARPDAC